MLAGSLKSNFLKAAILGLSLSGQAHTASIHTHAHNRRVTSDTASNVVPEQYRATIVVVGKSQRRLYLMHNDTVLRSYRIALGANPDGPKTSQGDSRTPEGHYVLTQRNPRSEYFMSIQISYPNDKDLQRARRSHVDPGNSIMIHGVPNDLRREPTYYETRDWTDGCIAVSNSDMLEIWLMVPPGTPIDIQP